MANFEQHIKFALTVYIECENCGIELMVEDDDFADQGVDVSSAFKQVVKHTQKYKWQISDLQGKLDGEYPVCQKCFETGGKNEN